MRKEITGSDQIAVAEDFLNFAKTAYDIRLEDGHVPSIADDLAMANTTAAVAQAQQTKRIADLLESVISRSMGTTSINVYAHGDSR